MSLAAYNRQYRPDDQISIFDERTEANRKTGLKATLTNFKPQLIGFSILTAEAPRLAEMTSLCKSICPDAKIIVGGPHVSAYKAKVLEDKNTDYILSGEGEASFLELINALENSDSSIISSIPGLGYRDQGELKINEVAKIPVDIESLPLPAWDLIDINDYTDLTRMSGMGPAKYAALFTSRGCPYGCTYCHSIFTTRFRAMSPEKVLGQIEHLISRYNVQEFEIFDDIFNCSYKRTEKICDMIIERRLNIKLHFSNGVRADRMDRNLVHKLARAGTTMMALAIESANPRIQKMVRKNVDLIKMTEIINYSVEEKIFVWGYFMIGFPTETREEIMRTIEFACNSKLYVAMFFVVIPFEGTELFKQTGMISSDPDVSSFTGPYFIPNEICDVPSAELHTLRTYANFKFFMNPKRVMRILRDFPYSYRRLLGQGIRFSILVAKSSLILVKNKVSPR